MVSRRDFVIASAASLLVPSLSLVAQKPSAKKSLRFAYATDMHVQPEKRAGEGWAKCLQHIHELKDKPSFILTGGDLIFDALGATPERTQKQWDTFFKAIKDVNRLPMKHAIGNHDVFGWSNGSKYESDPKFGKAWALEALEMSKPYYSFDQGGWHFIVLDSIHRAGNGYVGKLDDEQFEWLRADLEKTPKDRPVVVVSHIPILMVCSLFDGQNEKSGNWVIPGSYMHIDARRIKDLFLKHPNVKLCLSGHEHQLDLVVYNGVTYVCGGAVSAGWWGGNYFECTYGYNLIDLYENGEFRVEYTPYGWA